MIYKRASKTLLCLQGVEDCFHLFFFSFSIIFPIPKAARGRLRSSLRPPGGDAAPQLPPRRTGAENADLGFLQNFIVKGLGLLWAFGSGENSWARGATWPMATVPVPKNDP